MTEFWHFFFSAISQCHVPTVPHMACLAGICSHNPLCVISTFSPPTQTPQTPHKPPPPQYPSGFMRGTAQLFSFVPQHKRYASFHLPVPPSSPSHLSFKLSPQPLSSCLPLHGHVFTSAGPALHNPSAGLLREREREGKKIIKRLPAAQPGGLWLLYEQIFDEFT